MIYEVISISILLGVASAMLYFSLKFESKRQRKFNALVDEMYLYYKNLNDKEFNL